MSGPRSVVFLGPSLPLERARQLLPEAIFRPPARQSDVISAVRIDSPQVIGIIDGTFAQTLSVWHKEILYALQQGIHVFGAASMGALRAAECDVFGMVGIGEIYRAYRDGVLRDDDEVALMHASGEEGYRGLTEAMVNVRATIAAASAAGLFGEGEEQLVVSCAKAVHFTERSWEAIFRASRRAGLALGAETALRAFVGSGTVDVKGRDAAELLEHLAGLPAELPPALPSEPLARSSVFVALYERDRRVKRPAGEVSLDAIARWAMLAAPGADDLLELAQLREVAAAFAAFLQLETTAEMVASEKSRFMARRRLRSEDDLARWLERNDLDESDFGELVRLLATGRRMRAWVAARRFKRQMARPLLDELRLAGRYPEVADEAAADEAALSGIEEEGGLSGGEPVGLTRRQLIAEQAAASSWLPDTSIDQWAIESGFEDAFDVYIEMLRHRALRSRQSSS